MNMNDWPKAVTTASIWVSIGFSLGFGLFRMNFSGRGAVPMLLLLTGLLIAGGVVATVIVWREKPSKSDSERNK